MMDAIKAFLAAVDVFFVIYLIGYSTFLFLSVFFGTTELYQRQKEKSLNNRLRNDFYVPISVIVPAHNEEKTAVDTVCTLLEQDYRLFEIIVVDDGSTDRTAENIIEYFKMYSVRRPIRKKLKCEPEKKVYEAKIGNVLLTLVTKENGGKADALNMGINVSRFPYFICIDADSMLQKDSLYEIAKPILEDDKVVACGGLIRISNGVKLKGGEVVDYSLPKKLIVAMQVLEYDRSFLASRIFMDKYNGNLIISGAFGLFKKNEVILAGGYDSSTMGEDMELVVKLHSFCRINHIPYRIRYVPEAVCWSQAPGTLKDLIKQRRRWHIGLFESLMKYRQSVGKKEYGMVGTLSLLYFWLYEFLSPYIELFGLFTVLLSYAVNLINSRFMILFFAVYAIFGCVLTLIAFFSRIYTAQLHITLKDSVKAILLSGFELVGMRFILMLVRMNALFGYQKNKNDWGELERFENERE